MKKFLAPVLGLVAVFGLFGFDIASAALIEDTDSPGNIQQATGAYRGSFRQAVTTIVNYFLFFLGLVATVMVIYGGFLYITSAGDDAGAEKGKNILIYAAIGIVVILVSFALVNTLLGAGTGNAPT